jgi:putative phosphoribosyl transferase
MLRSRDQLFDDRADAGAKLAERLQSLSGENCIVLGLARGGLVVAEKIAEALHAPLDVFVARKIGAPRQPELGIGAIAPGVQVLDQRLIEKIAVSAEELEQTIVREEAELRRRLQAYRADQQPPSFASKLVVLVDDGLATGITAIAAARSIRREEPKRLLFAAPVCSPSGAAALGREVDEVVCLVSPDNFYAVGAWYGDFRQTEDDEVLEILSRRRHGSRGR